MSGLQEYYPSKFSMIHVVGDVILIVGITVFLNSKINSQAAEIAELKKQNDILSERLDRIEKFLQQGLQHSSPLQERPPQETHPEEESEEIDT